MGRSTSPLGSSVASSPPASEHPDHKQGHGQEKGHDATGQPHVRESQGKRVKECLPPEGQTRLVLWVALRSR